jgi:signal transduction histidine kinase
MFANPGFMPHIHCYLSQPLLVWTMAVTDSLIGIAYVAISFTLWVLIRQINLKFNLVVSCFILFIGACGATHFMEVWTLWNPDYWISAAFKVLTSIASVGTGIYLFRIRQTVVSLSASANLSEQRRIELESERDLREKFVATLSHDLRSPLTAAKLNAQRLARSPLDPEAVKKMATTIVKNIDRTDRMIGNLLDANRIKAGEKLPIEITECNLTQMAQETLAELGAIHGDRFLLEAPASPLLGFWSCSGLQIILENLCTNATKYGSSERKIVVTISKSDSQMALSVHNWGAPIPIEDQESLFDPYWRTKSAESGGEKGWGLGLTLVKGLADAHGGNVSVESDLERGTVFRVSLPTDLHPPQ